MTIETVRENLVNTIKGKEKLLDIISCECSRKRPRGEIMALEATVDFLKLNLAELRKILKDVEACLD